MDERLYAIFALINAKGLEGGWCVIHGDHVHGVQTHQERKKEPYLRQGVGYLLSRLNFPGGQAGTKHRQKRS